MQSESIKVPSDGIGMVGGDCYTMITVGAVEAN